MAERDVLVGREAIRLWINRLGGHLACRIMRDRPRPADKWHLDEAAITMGGETHWLWPAVDAKGDAPDVLVQRRRNAKAAKRFLRAHG